MIWKPRYEGYDHINIHPQSKSPLGRALSFNFKSIFRHPEHGLFYSLAAYYYWALNGKQCEELKTMYGRDIMVLGPTKTKLVKIDKKFKAEIQAACVYKIMENEYIQELLVKCSLPFTYYYYYGDPMGKVIMYNKAKKFMYILEAVEEIRLNLKKNGIIRTRNKPKHEQS
jgi:hypothetical protein